MTDHYSAMVKALKRAQREAQKALSLCDKALAECRKARLHLDKAKQSSTDLEQSFYWYEAIKRLLGG